jgi:hypothetical protein
MKVLKYLILAILFDFATSQCENIEDVTLTLIKGKSVDNINPVAIPWTNIKSLLDSRDYNNRKPSVVYAHGFNSTFYSSSVQTVIKAYITRRSLNRRGRRSVLDAAREIFSVSFLK